MKRSLEQVNGFDVVLTNPPFSMWYEIENEEEARILRQYELAKKSESTSNLRSRVRSMELFIERYYGFLKPNGRMLTIIDETILSAPKFSITRNYIRRHFIIKGIISLHGDAFRMSGSRVKTAILFLEKKARLAEQQESAFMYPSIYLGVDDLPVTSSKTKIEEARRKASEEIKTICEEFDKYTHGQSKDWVVPFERMQDRLDVKYCLYRSGRLVNEWKSRGYELRKVSDIAKQVENIIIPQQEGNADKNFRILTISYDGRIRISEIRKGKDIGYNKMKVVKKGDLVFSEYNTIRGAIGFVTEEFEDALASGSYTVVRCENEYDTLYLWSILRTTELRVEMLMSAVGVGRQTIDWTDISRVCIPLPDEKERKAIYQEVVNVWKSEKQNEKTSKELIDKLNSMFSVESEHAKKLFEANKPPR